MGIVEMMKFDDSVNLTRGPWWLWGIGIGIVNMVVTVILEIMKLAMDMDAVMDIVGLVFTVVFVWMALGVWVGRLRNRGYTEPVEFALRIILVPWGLVECGFLAGASEE
ncbi:MAG: hypothetical protein HOE00_01865 [Euryarchaeota archaeon]|jgi:uncharacterized membrane protein YhaH (DUF805 family)|nr:hypothetical protein [Euryarchaeota archaeon]DAC63014.1 MAG TPA: hypothetical protein D7I02_02920 [Candidatus Poseidoniales archaeon]HII12731.1 hypothetical protein [Candidatus Thalassarchaeaceae archaeon]